MEVTTWLKPSASVKYMAKNIHATSSKETRLMLQESAKIAIEYYEYHKTEFKNKTDAAFRIFEQKLVPVKYSTIYRWLDRHIRKIKK